MELNGTEHKPTKENFFDWKSWGCATRMFSGVTFGYEVDTNKSTSSYSTSPIPTTNFEKSIGCLEMKMYPWEDQGKKQRLYFQSEIAIKNEQFGVVLWTGLLLGHFPKNEESSHNNEISFEFQHRMVFLEKADEAWSIKHGYGWYDGSLLTASFDQNGNFLTLKTPNEYWLNRSQIVEINKSHSWLGVWEEQDLKDSEATTNSPPKEDDGNHPLKDIDIAIGSFSDYDEPDREVYGLDKDKTFDSNSSKGYGHSSHLFYEADKWKKMTSTGVHTTLNKWYSIFRDKKGKWTEINRRCYDLSVSRRKDLLGIDQLRDLCYSKSK